MAFITIAGQNKIAQKQGNADVLTITHFVLANIDGLGSEPVDRIETMPDVADIVDTQPVTKSGYINTNQVVYSLTLDSTMGDYNFNWVGLKDEDDVLIAVVYIDTAVEKTATAGGIDGNNLVRNFLLAYNGIQATTAINAPAETWQIDFTTRLIQIDERERLSNLDIYGHEAFFADGFSVEHDTGTDYTVSAGVAYIGGLRVELSSAHTITIASMPNQIWIDAALQGDLTGKAVSFELVVSEAILTDYTDGNGIEHYVALVADITSSSVIEDERVSSVTIISQADAEAGTQHEVKSWTALRVRQAINAVVKTATEGVKGIANIATQANVDAGTNDTDFVTPKKMRYGFSILIEANGYIVFPSWFGSFIIQWGRIESLTYGSGTPVIFTIPFTTKPRNVGVQLISTESSVSNTRDEVTYVNDLSITSSGFTAQKGGTGDNSAFWFAIGK